VRKERTKWKLLERAWPCHLRPEHLQKRSVVRDYTLEELLDLKRTIDAVDGKNLGEEVISRDEKPKKIKYRAQVDDGKENLHLVRWNRQPLVHPKHYYDKVPKKQEVVVCNFPMEHLGISGRVADTTISRMHNRAVKVTLDLFCKTTNREARGPHRAGKYWDPHQLRERVVYSTLLHVLWPKDYSGHVITMVLNEAKWAEEATSDDKKRAELVTEFFYSVVNDNCMKAARDQ
jgi:hypothetical protein